MNRKKKKIASAPGLLQKAGLICVSGLSKNVIMYCNRCKVMKKKKNRKKNRKKKLQSGFTNANPHNIKCPTASRYASRYTYINVIIRTILVVFNFAKKRLNGACAMVKHIFYIFFFIVLCYTYCSSMTVSNIYIGIHKLLWFFHGMSKN